MTEREWPKIGERWMNTRRGFTYIVKDHPLWSDSPDEENLERWILLENVVTRATYVRSLESFFGTNRSGQPRFTKVV